MSAVDSREKIIDPIKFIGMVWPHIKLYDKQRDILYSVRDNPETVVPAGNGLGKDFVSALVVLWWMCSRRPARCVTTSVKHDQLNDVLWGEIRRLLNTAAVNLPIRYNHLHIRQVYQDGTDVPLCELVGQVVNKGEGLLGRHLPRDIPRTLVVFDEASGIEDFVYESVDTWAHTKLVIGNCYPCVNFFFRKVEAGTVMKPHRPNEILTKVIRIKAEDSPNVQLGMAHEALGEDKNPTLIPGVVDYETYRLRRGSWDQVRQCIGLDAAFWKGAQVLMFPPAWLNHAEELAAAHKRGQRLMGGKGQRMGKAIGVDPAEGGDSTCFCAVDEHGILELVSKKTPDTNVISGETIAFAKKWGVEPEFVLFDRGGGGKQIADRLRAQGFMCETLAFGEPVTPERRRGIVTLAERKEQDEERYAYKNRRAQIYHEARMLIDPDGENGGFAIPAEYTELRRQLAPLPLLYDGEGRIWLYPKNKSKPTSNEVCLQDLLGCSPDEADSFCLAVYRLLYQPRQRTLGSMFG